MLEALLFAVVALALAIPGLIIVMLLPVERRASDQNAASRRKSEGPPFRTAPPLSSRRAANSLESRGN